jgi:hypothetical protein
LIGTVLAGHISSPGTLYGQVDISNIIDSVRANEDLYKNSEVVYSSEYTDLHEVRTKSDDPNHHRIIKRNVRVRFVRQGGMFHLRLNGGVQYIEGGSTRDRIRLFDGETSRVRDERVVNIVAGPTVDEYMSRPHMLLLQQTGYPVPLSTFLSGHQAMSAYPGLWWDRNQHLRTDHLGEGSHAGRPCQKVAITHIWAPTGEPLAAWVLWLATDRNYIPVHCQAFTYQFSKDSPVGEAAVHEWRELASGVWFPTAAEVAAYDKPLVKNEKRFKPIWRERYAVEAATLNPSYPIEFFRDLDIPDGTTVYEVENGEVVRSYRQGASGAPGRASAHK